MNVSIQSLETEALHKEPSCHLGFELTSLIGKLHQNLGLLAEKQSYDLDFQNKELEFYSKKFLEDLKTEIDLQKQQSYLKPISYTIEMLGSFISIVAGSSLCATGVFATCGAIMIATGIAGICHTGLQMAGAYDQLSQLFHDKEQIRVVMDYLPAMISVTLVLSSTLTFSISGQAQKEIIKGVVSKFLPAILKSLEAANMSASSFIFYKKSSMEVKKIDQKQLSLTLETWIEEQKNHIFDQFSLQKNLCDQTSRSLKILSDLLKTSL